MFGFLFTVSMWSFVLVMQTINLFDRYNQYKEVFNTLSWIFISISMIITSFDGLELYGMYNQLKMEYIKCMINLTN